MSATEHFRAGRLQDALTAQTQAVKSNPADPAKRLFLFQLLCFTGDLDRAEKQIDAVKFGDPASDLAVLLFRRMLDAERERRKVFREGKAPTTLAEPPAHMRHRLEALRALREGKLTQAVEALRAAAQSQPAIQGMINGKPFTSLRDLDDRFATVLEVFLPQGLYGWLPIDQVKKISINAPRTPTDLIWASANLELAGGHSMQVFLPALYPDTENGTDDQLRLGYRTDWTEQESGIITGLGMHTFLVDEQEELGILEWREVTIASNTQPA